MRRRRKGIFLLAGLSIVAAVFFQIGSMCGVREKVVDYWNEGENRSAALINEMTAEVFLDKTIYVDRISTDKYAYNCLDQEGRQVYDEILHAILNHMDKITVSTLNTEVVKTAFDNVEADYGGLFWINGYRYTEYTRNGEAVGIEFVPKYTMTYEERKEVQEQIDAEVERILSGVSPTDSDYDKAKYVFEMLIDEVEYDKDVPDSQNIISVFLGKKTVCQGYACATLYLLNQLNIRGVIVTGLANGEAHAWNMVMLDGEYYYMDTTWGNSAYSDNEGGKKKFCNYSYLAFSTAEMEEAHTPDGRIRLPECTAVENNYFVREGCYFEEWDPDGIGEVFGRGIGSELQCAAVKFATEELYENAKAYFIGRQHLADYCEIVGNLYYMEEPERNVLTIKIK